MKRAFVLEPAPDSDFVGRMVEGWITVEGWEEDVDNSPELKFRSVPELLEFLSAALKTPGTTIEPQE